MNVSARIGNSHGRQTIRLTTGEHSRANDIYREAAPQGVNVTGVEVALV